MANTIILIMYQEKWLSAGNISRFHLKEVPWSLPNGMRLGMPMPRWYYFGKDGVLQEFVGKQVLEAKLLQIPTNIMGNNMIVQQRNESIILKISVAITL